MERLTAPLNAHQKGLIAMLQAACWQTRPDGLHYFGPADFVIRHGVWCEPAPCPDDVPEGAPACCHGNALMLATLYPRRFALYEGFATNAGFEMVWHHSWVVEYSTNQTSRRVIDNTWRTPGLAYLGVQFAPSRADDATWNGDATILDDWKRNWPLFQERWQGELHEPLFEPTPANLILLTAMQMGITPDDLLRFNKEALSNANT